MVFKLFKDSGLLGILNTCLALSRSSPFTLSGVLGNPTLRPCILYISPSVPSLLIITQSKSSLYP